MRKFNAVCLIIALLLALSLSVPALASISQEEAIAYMENVNLHIEKEITKAQKKADKALAHGDEEEIDEIIEHLLSKTSEMVREALEWAEEHGVNAIHYFITVEIGGREVLVDPIHVLW
jgi:glycerate-2-kinase